MRNAPRRKRATSDFSLIELLVTVAIIAMLTAILLPTLGKARESARKILCANNQKQIYLGVTAYVNDYAGYLSIWKYWVRDVADGMGMKYPATMTYGPTQKTPNLGTFLCPSTAAPGDPSKGWKTGAVYNNEPFLTSYGPTLCVDTATAVAISQGGWQLYYLAFQAFSAKKLAKVMDGSVLLIEPGLYCVNWSVINVSDYTKPSHTNTLNGTYGGTQFRHALSANFLFKDGHVAMFKAGAQFDGNWVPR